jgi:hypothetical protein
MVPIRIAIRIRTTNGATGGCAGGRCRSAAQPTRRGPPDGIRGMRPQIQLRLHVRQAYRLNLQCDPKSRDIQRLLIEAGCQVLERRRL